jgi:hypothetical protein
MALYIRHSIFLLALLLYVRPETFGHYYLNRPVQKYYFLLITGTTTNTMSRVTGVITTSFTQKSVSFSTSTSYINFESKIT